MKAGQVRDGDPVVGSCGNRKSTERHQCCCGNEKEQSAYGCYICGLKGLLHCSKASTFSLSHLTSTPSSSLLQQGSYDLILDHPSLQKWWDIRHNPDTAHGHGVSSSLSCDTTVIVVKFIQTLRMLHSNHIHNNGDNTDKSGGSVEMDRKSIAVMVRIPSVFISMDIFQNKKSMHWSEPQQQLQQSSMIRSVLCLLKESLPHLQSVHLYNGPISGNVFFQSVSTNDSDDDDDDDDEDWNTTVMTNDDQPPPTRREHRLYHRWNRFRILDDRDDHENDLDRGNDMTHHDDDDDDSDETNAGFPVMINGSMLASIIEASMLQSITVTRCLCFDNCNDVVLLARSLHNHPCLSSVHLASMYLHPNFFTNGKTTTQPSLDPLIKALSSLSQLESLNITLAKESRISIASNHVPLLHSTKSSTPSAITIISPQAIQQLIAATTILDLTLWECLLNGSHLKAISEALLCGSTGGMLNEEIVAARTEPKQTLLQFLSLRCNPNITCDDWCTFYMKTLPNCYSIQSIYNDHVCGLADCDPNLPNHGNTREGLRFWDIDTTTTTSDETLSSEISTSEAAANAELFLGLNSLGRGSIIQGSYTNRTNATADMELQYISVSENDKNLLDLLSDVTDTPSALYALIRSHPMMILSFIHHQS